MKDRQVQHNFRESRHQCSSCPNFACHKCLARESNPRHLCSKQSILPLDHHSRIKLELGNSNDILQARNLSSSCKPQPCSQVLLWQGTGPLTVQGCWGFNLAPKLYNSSFPLEIWTEPAWLPITQVMHDTHAEYSFVHFNRLFWQSSVNTMSGWSELSSLCTRQNNHSITKNTQLYLCKCPAHDDTGWWLQPVLTIM